MGGRCDAGPDERQADRLGEADAVSGAGSGINIKSSGSIRGDSTEQRGPSRGGQDTAEEITSKGTGGDADGCVARARLLIGYDVIMTVLHTSNRFVTMTELSMLTAQVDQSHGYITPRAHAPPQRYPSWISPPHDAILSSLPIRFSGPCSRQSLLECPTHN